MVMASTGATIKTSALEALFETLSGMKMSELFGKVRTIGSNKNPEPEEPPSAMGTGAGK